LAAKKAGLQQTIEYLRLGIWQAVDETTYKPSFVIAC